MLEEMYCNNCGLVFENVLDVCPCCNTVQFVHRAERIWLKPNKQISKFCRHANWIYNKANYFIRQHFFKTGEYPYYRRITDKLLNLGFFYRLPPMTADMVVETLDNNWKAYFAALRSYKEDPSKFKARPRPPGYRKRDSEFMFKVDGQYCKIRNGNLHVYKRLWGWKFKTRLPDGTKIQELRIVPKGIGYVLEMVYKKWIHPEKLNKDNVAGIDLGLKNIVTFADINGGTPFVVKGGILKSINQFYNKELARLQGIYSRQGIWTGAKRKKLTLKRGRKISDYMHKLSRYVINHCIDNNIGTLALGYCKDWKQRINLGRVTNQNFVQIPFSKLLFMLSYKGAAGIQVIYQDEAHTSKCSYLDNESVEHHDTYIGKRTSRGLFRSANGTVINADLNAAYNIAKKAILKTGAKVLVDEIEGVPLHPVRIEFLQNSIQEVV